MGRNMKKLIAITAVIGYALLVMPAYADMSVSIGAAQVDGSDTVRDDTMVAVELSADVMNWLRIGVHGMGDADTNETIVSKTGLFKTSDVVTTRASDYRTYGACGTAFAGDTLEFSGGVCFGEHDYGFRDETAWSGRLGIAGKVKGFNVGAGYFHDFTHDEQRRFMVTAGMSW